MLGPLLNALIMLLKLVAATSVSTPDWVIAAPKAKVSVAFSPAIFPADADLVINSTKPLAVAPVLFST